MIMNNNTDSWEQLVSQSKTIKKITFQTQTGEWQNSVHKSKKKWKSPESTVTYIPPYIHSTRFSASIEQVDKMSGAEFEEFMEHFFMRKGYKVTRTKLSGDFGVDLIIERNQRKYGIQLKRYSNKVSLKAVQELLGGLEYYNLDEGIVITNNFFQNSAIDLAEKCSKPIALWDRIVLALKLGT